MAHYNEPRTLRTTIEIDFTTYEEVDADEFHDVLRQALENLAEQIELAIGEEAESHDPANYVSLETIRDIDITELDD